MNDQSPKLRQISPEVFYSDGGFLSVDATALELLQEHATLSSRRRCRLCFHADPSAPQQEMLIMMHRSSYVRPHRHKGKVETLGLIAGECDAVLFKEDGAVGSRFRMSPAADGGCFFYRMPSGLYHSLIIRSEWLAFVETTIGPFDRAMTEDAAWAPPESDPDAGHAYLASLPIQGLKRFSR